MLAAGLHHPQIIRDLAQRDLLLQRFKTLLSVRLVAEEEFIDPEEKQRLEVVRVGRGELAQPLGGVRVVLLVKVIAPELKRRPVVYRVQPVG